MKHLQSSHIKMQQLNSLKTAGCKLITSNTKTAYLVFGTNIRYYIFSEYS